jgi:hypothetical protein
MMEPRAIESSMYRTRACMIRFGLMSLSSLKACRAHQDSAMKSRFVSIWTNASEPVPSEESMFKMTSKNQNEFPLFYHNGQHQKHLIYFPGISHIPSKNINTKKEGAPFLLPSVNHIRLVNPLPKRFILFPLIYLKTFLPDPILTLKSL